MAKLSNVEIAYQFLQDHPEGVEFNAIWNQIVPNIHADNEDKSRLIADLYADMVLDNRFGLTSDGKWALKSSLSLDDVKRKYDFVDSFDYDADFDDIDDEELSGEHGNDPLGDEETNIEDDDDQTTDFDSEDSYGDGDEDDDN